MSRQTLLKRRTASGVLRRRWRTRGKGRRKLGTASSLKRVRLCGHQAVGNMVSLRRGPHGGDYGKVATCGSIWVCPVCSARILSERTSEIARGFETWEGGGGTVGMATLTVRHNRSQRLKDVWGIVGKAWSRMTSGRAWATVTDRLGLVGWMRTVEMTHGANGWHVHLHVLLFVRDVDQTDFMIGQQLLLERWADSVSKVGGSVVSDAQDVRMFVDVEGGDLGYFAKAYYDGADAGEDVAFEVTRSDLKSGSGRAPMEILHDAVESGVDVSPDWVLWREYEQASHRKRMHTWSRGMRDLLGLNDERTDEEIAADEDGLPEVVTVGWINRQDWHRVRASDALYWGLLDAVDADGLEGAQAWGLRRGITVMGPEAEERFFRFLDVEMPKGYNRLG